LQPIRADSNIQDKLRDTRLISCHVLGYRLSASPDLVLIPSAFLFATVLALNLLSDALRERWSA
jgi:ABC-type dipeptide/oligopeptide/nickel transport system permease subunit